MRDTGFRAGVAQVLGVLVAGLGFARRDDHGDTHEHLDRLGRAAGRHGAGAYLVDLSAHRRVIVAADEHALGMLAGKTQPAW